MFEKFLSKATDAAKMLELSQENHKLKAELAAVMKRYNLVAADLMSSAADGEEVDLQGTRLAIYAIDLQEGYQTGFIDGVYAASRQITKSVEDGR